MTFSDQTPSPLQQQPGDNLAESDILDFDRLAATVLLTVQALQRLHAAFDRRFTR
jgi:hypothetical protein